MRRVTRVNSNNRLNALLDTGINIIAKEGIRAITHRTLAKRCGFPLSSTTYYFDDIKDLQANCLIRFIELTQDINNDENNSLLASLNGTEYMRLEHYVHTERKLLPLLDQYFKENLD